MKGGLGCSYHNDHVHVKEEEVFVCAKFLPDAEKEIARDSFAIHNPAGSVGALLQKRTKRILTPAQLEYFRKQTMEHPHLSSLDETKSPAQHLIDYLRESPDISFILVTDHPESKLCSIRKQSARGRAAATVGETTETMNETSLTGFDRSEAEEYAAGVRRSLKVADGKEILLAVAWITDQERRLVTLYPEVLASDVTEQTNREKRSLLVVAGLTSSLESFTVCRALLPSCARWVFHWFFSTAMPALVPKKARLRNVVNFTDGDELEYNAFITAIPTSFPFSSHRLCAWHLINRGMKAASISSRNLTTKGQKYFDVAVKWIKSWCHSIETIDEFQHSYRIFEHWLTSDEVQSEDALTANVARSISDFVRKSMIPHSAKWLRSYFLYRRTFDRQSTQFVEAENSVMKCNPLGPKPQASLNVSAHSMTQLNKSRIDKKDKKAAIAMGKSQTSATWPDMDSNCNEKVVRELIGQYAKIGKRIVAKEDGSTFLVKSTSTMSVSKSCDHDDFPNYVIPSYSRVRVVKVVLCRQSLYLTCSCGLFERFGYPCADIYAVLRRPPQPSDVSLRYHKEFSHFYLRDTSDAGCSKTVDESFETAMANEPPGPLYSDPGLLIAPSAQLREFKNLLTTAIPVLRPESKWSSDSPEANNVLLLPSGLLATAHQPSHIQLPLQQHHIQEVTLSQAAKQELLEEDFDDNNACSDNENYLQSSRRDAWLQKDSYKNHYSLFTEMSKLADGSFEAYKIFNDCMLKGLEHMRSAAVEDIKQAGRSISGPGVISSCLELERSLKSKRKRPFGSPGRK
jgi:hypothetical protein